MAASDTFLSVCHKVMHSFVIQEKQAKVNSVLQLKLQDGRKTWKYLNGTEFWVGSGGTMGPDLKMVPNKEMEIRPSVFF